jgi:hypothetical protein
MEVKYKVREEVTEIPVEPVEPTVEKKQFLSIYIDGSLDIMDIPIPDGKTSEEICKEYLAEYSKDHKAITSKDIDAAKEDTSTTVGGKENG